MSTPDCCRGVPGDGTSLPRTSKETLIYYPPLTFITENYKPKGLFLDKHNLNVYEVKASCGTNKGTLLFLPDAFGLASHNVILSDLYAIEG
jgi:hypothetical protein